MASQLSPDLREYLKRCGLPERKISHCSSGTRMYHDLGLYGDTAEACIEVLVDRYQVDVSGFDFEKFFPPEFEGKNWLTRTFLWIIPFARGAARRCAEYLPLTLEMIETAIRRKRLSSAQQGSAP